MLQPAAFGSSASKASLEDGGWNLIRHDIYTSQVAGILSVGLTHGLSASARGLVVSRRSSRGSTMMLLKKTSAGSAEDFDAVQSVAMMAE
jgi:hypothetical protein